VGPTIVFLVATASWGGAALAAEMPGEIRGQVRVTRAGQPVADAEVSWIDRGGMENDIGSVRTDLDGVFDLDHWAGRLHLRVGDGGHWANVVVAPAQTADLEIDIGEAAKFWVWTDGAVDQDLLMWPDGDVLSLDVGGWTAVHRAGWARLGDDQRVWLTPTSNRIDLRGPGASQPTVEDPARRTCPVRPVAAVHGTPTADDLRGPTGADWGLAPSGPIPLLAYPVDLGIDGRLESRGGRVRDVHGAGAAAGVRIGDLITAVDGVSWRGADDGRVGMYAAFPSCADLTLTIERAGRTVTVEVPATY